MRWLFPILIKSVRCGSSSNTKRTFPRPRRSLRLESLENRQMLSISPTIPTLAASPTDDTVPIETASEEVLAVEVSHIGAVDIADAQAAEPAVQESRVSSLVSEASVVGWERTELSVAANEWTVSARAFNESGSYTVTPSVDSAVSTTSHDALPQTPTRLLVSPQSSTMIVLSWDAVSDASYYRLEYRMDTTSSNGETTGDSSDWIALGNTVEGYDGKLVSKTLYAHQSLLPSTRYEYRLTAVNELGDSDSVIESAVTTARVLDAPEEFDAEVLSSSSIQLTWNVVPNAAYYRLEYAPTGADYWITLSSMLTKTSYTQTGLSSNTEYVYRVTACQLLEESESVTTSATTLPGTLAAPEYFSATAQNSTTILLTWLSTETVDGYRLEYSLGGQNQWQPLGGTFSSSTIFLHIRLTPGTVYDYRLVAYHGTENSNAVMASAKTLGAVPAAPTGLTVEQATTDSLQLVWNAVDNANSYRLEYRLTTESQLTEDDWIVLDDHLTTTTFTHTGLTVDTAYTYRLVAINSFGDSKSTLLSTRTRMYPPATPQHFVSELVDDGGVRLSWTTATDTMRWRLEYAFSEQSEQNDEWILLSDSLTVSEYLQTGLFSNTTYYWRLTAWNTGGDSESVVISRTIPREIPKAPTNITAITQGSDSIYLSWDPVWDANLYKVEWSITGSLWFKLDNVNTTACIHEGLSEETTYYYRVSAMNSLGASGYGYTQGATSSVLLSEPTGLSTTLVKSSQIRLAWNAVSGATSYRLEYSTDGQTWLVGDAHLTTTGYIHSGLAAETQYYYRLAAQNATQRSDYVTLTAQTTADLLESPSAFSVTPFEGLNARLSWNAVDGAAGYQVEYSLSGTDWTPLSGSSITSTGYLHLNIAANTLYYYRVRTVGDDSVSTWTTTSIRLLVALEAPTNFTATALDSTSLELQWSEVSKATRYRVEWSSNDGSTWQTLGVYTTTSVIHQNLSPKTTYQYRVTAQNNLYASWSVSCSGTTDEKPLEPPATPTEFAVRLSPFDANAEIMATFSWSALGATPNVTGYQLYESVAGGVWSLVFATEKLDTSEILSTTFVRTGLTAETRYDYQLFAVNADGASAPTLLSVQTPKFVPILVPEIPNDLAATWQNAQTVLLSWTPVTNATGYRLESSPDGVHWHSLVDLSEGLLGAYSVVCESSRAYYRIAALYTDASSAVVATAWSDAAVLAPKVPDAPDAPQMVRTSSSAARVQLRWSKVSADGYQLFRSVNGGEYQLLATLSNTQTSYTDTALSAGNEYEYQICAANHENDQWVCSAFSATSASGTIVIPLKSPSGVKLVANSDGSSTMSWSADAASLQAAFDSVSNGSGFQYVLTRTVDTTSQAIALPIERLTPIYNSRGVQTGWSYTDTGLDFSATGFPANSVISYNLRAETVFVTTASLRKSLTVTTAPETATDLQVVTIGKKSVTLRWTAPTSGASAYQVQRLTYNSDGTPVLKRGEPAWTTLRTVSDTEYTDKSVKTGVYYAYRVVSYNTKARLASAPTDSIQILTAAAKVSSFKTVKNGVTSDTVTLSGTIPVAVYGATYQFRLHRDSGDGVYREITNATWSLDTSGRNWVVTVSDATVSGGVTYRYQMQVAIVSSELSQPLMWSPVSSSVRVKTVV